MPKVWSSLKSEHFRQIPTISDKFSKIIRQFLWGPLVNSKEKRLPAEPLNFKVLGKKGKRTKDKENPRKDKNKESQENKGKQGKSFMFKGPQMGGQIRHDRVWRFWGAPIFSPEVPK